RRGLAAASRAVLGGELGSLGRLRRGEGTRREGETAMTKATLIRRIAARPDIVFEALVTSEGIRSWWGPDEHPAISAFSDARVGGRFEVRFRTADRREHVCAGEVLWVVRPERVVLSWRWIFGGEADE